MKRNEIRDERNEYTFLRVMNEMKQKPEVLH